MMKLREVINFIAAEPFQPFRIKVADGRSFEVQYPDDVSAGINIVRVYGAIDDGNGSQEQWHKIPLALIEAIEPIQATNRPTP